MVPTQDNPTENVGDLISPSILKKSTSRNEKEKSFSTQAFSKSPRLSVAIILLRFLLMRWVRMNFEPIKKDR